MGNFLTLSNDLRGFLLTGAIVSGTLQVVQIDVAYSILFDVWSKSLKQTFVTPISEYHYILGSWFFGIIRGIIVCMILGSFSAWAFKFYLQATHIVLLSMAGIFLSALVIGMGVLFIILYFGQRIMEVVWIITNVIMLICGIYYPVSMLPKAVQFAAGLIPVTYFLEFYRTGYGFKPVFEHDLYKGFGLCILYVIILFFMMRIAIRQSRKNGMILRLSE
jgi:ABC-2 type transport system permease protein